jgi:hypothetical protein
MPNGTELHVGFFAPQSKHIYSPMLALIDRYGPSLSLPGNALCSRASTLVWRRYSATASS